jgi:cellulose synthase/poly-beta-1,6-N-acetylglucosamine synthase-like glycosyltransferase
MKKVSVIVPAYREEPSLLNQAIEALMKQSYKDYNVFLVLDSAASSEIKKFAATLRYKHLKVVQDKKRGSAAHRNLGVKKAWNYSDYFAFTDADCIAEKNWLRNLVSAIEKLPKNVGCVGGLNLSKESTAIGKAIECAEASFMGGGGVSGQTTIRKKQKYVNSIPNCNAIYRKECWEKNKQDEKFIRGQDAEFNLRLAKQGWKFIQIPDAVIYHKKQDTLLEYAKRMYKYGKASAKIIRKHGLYGLRRFWYSAGVACYIFVLLLFLVSGFINTKTLNLLMVFFGIYVTAIILSSLFELRRNKLSSCLIAVPLLFMQHVVYVFGFVVGLIK